MRSPSFPRPSARPRTALAAAMLALVPLVVACGNDDTATGRPSAVSATPAGDRASVSFTSPTDGDRVAGPVPVVMAADGVTIEEAGEVREGAGHLHVATDGGCLPEGEAIPKDADHVHFGKGQLEGELFLPAGTHELCLQVGDGAHVAQPITETLTVRVGVETIDEWCAVSNEIDEIGDEAEADATATLEDQQAAYAKGAALADQLSDGIDVIDPAHREGVEDMLAFFRSIAEAVLDAPDQATATSEVERLYDALPAEVEAAADWVSETCDAR